MNIIASVRTHTHPVVPFTRLSWYFLAACFWLLCGITLDSWAHNHVPRLETFFTPWHAVLYSGLLVTGLVLPGGVLLNRMGGQSWKDSIPHGYHIAVFGIFGAFIGGLGDMIWHILFGIEQNIDAQFSPTHITLMLFFGFVLAGPYHALYTSNKSSSRIQMLFSFTLLLTYWSIISQTAHPYTHLWLTNTPSQNGEGQILAVVSYFLQGAFLAALTMYTIRRWRVFFGFFTCALTLSALPLATMQNNIIVIPIGAVAGLFIDCAYRLMQPTPERKDIFRLFTALVPVIWLMSYTIILWMVYGTVWSIHMLVGSVVVVGLLCWLLSGLLFPLPLPPEHSPGEPEGGS